MGTFVQHKNVYYKDKTCKDTKALSTNSLNEKWLL